MPVFSFPHFKPIWLSSSLKIHKQFPGAPKRNIQPNGICKNICLGRNILKSMGKAFPIQLVPKASSISACFLYHFQKISSSSGIPELDEKAIRFQER